jgi:hypothetical protein
LFIRAAGGVHDADDGLVGEIREGGAAPGSEPGANVPRCAKAICRLDSNHFEDLRFPIGA